MADILTWQIISERAYRWGNRLMKPGQIFKALEEDMPDELKKVSILVNPIKEKATPVPSSFPPQDMGNIPTPAPYRIKSRGDHFDIVDLKGKRVNEQPFLTEEEAIDTLGKLLA